MLFRSFEPKTRNVDPDVLMESLFRSTDLEVRVPLNLNVLDSKGVPRVMSLKDALREFLDHRLVVLERRSRNRLDEISRRMEILRGQMVVYLNVDEVIRIIREADSPKPALIERFDLTDLQAEAILNLRLRALHKLEQIAIQKELDELADEATGIETLLADESLRWQAIDQEVIEINAEFGRQTELGKRRTELGGAPSAIIVPVHALVEREPVTVLCSDKGWIRAVKGHNVPLADQRYKEGDGPRFALETQTTDRLLIFASNGRFFTLGIDKLPGGRGHGEPLKLMIDLPNEAEIVALRVYRPGEKMMLVSTDGRGFIVNQDEAQAQTRAGKQVMNPADKVTARFCLPFTGDALALVGDNRKLLVLPLADIPEMTRGRGVILQKYKDGGLADAKIIRLAEGLSWPSGSRMRTEPDLTAWKTGRGSSGRMVPNGFPRPTRFEG